ncbi:MAG: site-specific integrase [Gemella sp.]|nr:site-specific integrase [Gemella sp.]
MIKQYTKNNKKLYMINNLYLGINPITGKEVRKTKRGFESKKEAEIYIAKQKIEFEKGSLFVRNKKHTFSAVYDIWIDNHRHTIKESSLNSYLSISKTILSILGNIDIKKITMLELQKIVNDWGNIYSKNYLNDLIKLLNMVFEYAVNINLLNSNPMDKIKKPRIETDDKEEIEKYYTKDELLYFLEVIKENYSPTLFMIFRLLGFTGARIGEVLALDWQDIDFKANTISINKTVSRGENNAQIVQSPKTKSSKRIIDVDPLTMQQLHSYKIAQRELLFKMGVRNNDYVFVNKNNRRLSSTSINTTLRRIQKKFNLKSISCHGFRHTHCSLMFEAGASIQAVQKRLGHSDFKTTMNIYNHVTEKLKQQTAIQFAEYMSI